MQIDLEDMIEDVEREKRFLFRVGAKYAVFGQSLLEVMDEMKDTPMFRGKTKNLINLLTKELEKNIHISKVFNEGQYIVTDLSKDVDNLLEQNLDKVIERIQNDS